MSKRIVLAGGGTGGHLFPLITVVKYLRENYSEEFEFLFLGPDSSMEKEIMQKENIPHKNILSGKLRRYFSWLYFVDIFKLPLGFFQALWHLFIFMPDVVFAKGGYATVPVALAAWIYRIPVVIHESDAVPGLANRFLGSLAAKIAITFERAMMYFPPSRVVITGLPVKETSLNGDKEKARKFLGMKNEIKPVVFFLGGSQGAKVMNDQIISMLRELTARYQVIHQTGKAHYDFVADEAQHFGYKIGHSDYYPVAFVGEEMRDLLKLADVVVSRAGSTAITEIAANEKPCIMVPLKTSASDHQRINAYELAKAGAAVVLEEDNFRESLLIHNIDNILQNEEERKEMSEKIKKFYHPNAARDISVEILKAAGM